MTHKIASNQCNYIVYYPVRIQQHKPNTPDNSIALSKPGVECHKDFYKEEIIQEGQLSTWVEGRKMGGGGEKHMPFIIRGSILL